MIGLFPTPFPDELLYSLCARYADRMKYPAKSALIRELLGSPLRQPVVDLPRHLDHLLAILPPSHCFSLQRLLNHHTLFPYYSPFLRQDAQSELVQHMQVGSGSGFYHRFGFVAAGVVWPTWLRFCPRCAALDADQFGQPFWRRLHQASGVLVCPAHRVFLQDSPISPRKHLPPQEFVSACSHIQPTTPIPLQPNQPDHSVLLHIAQDVDWLLNQSYSAFSLEAISRRYRYCLAEIFSAYNPSIDLQHQLLEKICRFYSPALLHQLHCSLDTQSPHKSWLFQLLRPDSSRNPLHHLLFIRFLGFTAQQFCLATLDNRTLWGAHFPAADTGQCLSQA